MPKSERETRRFPPYNRAEPQLSVEKTVDIRKKMLHYYEWNRTTLEEKLASTNENLQKLLATASEIQQQLGASGTCQEDHQASLRMRCGWITNEYIPVHRTILANVQRELDHACIQIREIETWLATQSSQSDAVALQFSGMRLNADDDGGVHSKTSD